jgi:hypothetical protein
VTTNLLLLSTVCATCCRTMAPVDSTIWLRTYKNWLLVSSCRRDRVAHLCSGRRGCVKSWRKNRSKIWSLSGPLILWYSVC